MMMRKKISLKIMSRTYRRLRKVSYPVQTRQGNHVHSFLYSFLSSRIPKTEVKVIDYKDLTFARQSGQGELREREIKVKSKFESLIKEDKTSDLYIVNTDGELTETIKNTFEGHGCQVSVSVLQQENLTALYVLLNKKISIVKLRKLMEKGKRFGLDFFLTKTGMSMLILNKIHNLFPHL